MAFWLIKTSCYDASYYITQSLLWVSQWHRGGVQENGNMWRHCSLALQWQSDGLTSYWRNPRAAEINKLFADNFKWKEWFNPTKPKDTTWCVLLPGSLDCSQWILHCTEVQTGLEKPARNDFSIDSLWIILHSGSTKTYIVSNDFKADKLSSEVWILGTGGTI